MDDGTARCGTVCAVKYPRGVKAMVRKRNAIVKRYTAGKTDEAAANAQLAAMTVAHGGTVWSFHADVKRPKLVYCDPGGRTSVAVDPVSRRGAVATWGLVGLFALALLGFWKSTQDEGREQDAPLTTIEAPTTTMAAPVTTVAKTVAPPATKR